MTGHWTTTPPTEPGWYWWRCDGRVDTWIIVSCEGRLLLRGCGTITPGEIGGEWYSERIEPPTSLKGKQMTVIEAMIYCLGYIDKTPEDGFYKSQVCYDRNGNHHWIQFRVEPGSRALGEPFFASDRSDCWTASLEPYSI